MSIEKTRAQIKGSIWQAIAQSEVDLSGVSQEDQEKLVTRIADHVMIAMNDLLEEMPSPEPPEEVMEEDGERVLWKGRPFLSMVESYVITTERVKVIRGVVSRGIENYELIRIQDIDLQQSINERLLGIGDITIRGQDASEPVLELRNVSRPDEVYEILRRAWLDARKRHGLQFREYM